jgi:hypothetical protein
MKLIKYLLAVAALTVALTLSAKANLMFLGAVDFNHGPNDPGTNHDVLEAFLGVDPGPLTNNFEGSGQLSGPVTVTPGEFFVVHYGKGPGGTGGGGSWEFFQVVDNETSVTFPQLGNGPTNPDPFGHGGISSARGFGGTPHTPDGGATAALLGLGLAGLAGLRAKFGRN